MGEGQPSQKAGVNSTTTTTCSGNTDMPLVSLNHVSFVCRSVTESARFYQCVLGFQLIKRPSSFNFEGAWLFAYGIGIHLLEAGSCEKSETGPNRRPINPKDNHISFQCSDMGLVMRRLQALGVDYVTATVQEGGVTVDQLFFHDPDGYMVEICNCNNLPVLPLHPSLANCPIQNNANIIAVKDPSQSQTPQQKQLRCSDNPPRGNLMPDIVPVSF